MDIHEKIEKALNEDYNEEDMIKDKVDIKWVKKASLQELRVILNLLSETVLNMSDFGIDDEVTLLEKAGRNIQIAADNITDILRRNMSRR